MRKQLMLFIPVLGIATFCDAQTLSPDVVSTAGGTNKVNNVSIEWTVGEPAVQTVTLADQIVTEGFHQPLLEVEILNQDESLAMLYNVIVAPNPVKNILTASVQSNEKTQIFLVLGDINGKDILKAELNSTAASKDFDMSNLAPGVYYMHARDDKGKLIKTYKIIKL